MEEIKKALEIKDIKIENLANDPDVLKQIIIDLLKRIASQENATKAQSEKIKILEEKIKILEGQLSLDSHNSSKPPSTDIVKKKKTSTQRCATSRKKGGQNGHKGNTLHKVANPDKIVVHKTSKCTCCGHDLSEASMLGAEKRQVMDLPKISLEVTEHQAEVKQCQKCGKINKGQFPENVKSPIQYGPRFLAQLVYLNQYQLIPYKRIQELVGDIYNHEISLGSIYNANEACYKKLEPHEKSIKKGLEKANVKHSDETGLKAETKGWFHVQSTKNLTFYYWSFSRGKVAMDMMGMLKDFKGILVHDHWQSYMKYGCLHAFCNAHHIRELTFVYEEEEKEWGKAMKTLLLDAKRQVTEACDSGRTSLEESVLNELEGRYDEIITQGLKSYDLGEQVAENNKKRGRKKQAKGKNLLDRLQKYKKETLLFIRNFEVPFDNNLAERDIRMTKVKQKISGGFRSRQGVKIFCRVRSFISTLKKQKLNILDALYRVFINDELSILQFEESIL